MMLNKNDDVERNMSKNIYYYNTFVKIMMLNKMFMFQYNLIRTLAVK